MQIVKIEPDQKYILVIPDATHDQVEDIVAAFNAFKNDEPHTILFIYGVDAVVVPVDQVVGYMTFEPGADQMPCQSRLAQLEQAWERAVNLYPDLEAFCEQYFSPFPSHR